MFWVSILRDLTVGVAFAFIAGMFLIRKEVKKT